MNFKIAVFFVLFAAILCAGTTAMAVPPCPGESIVEQPSGEKITVTLHGDEWFHWYESGDGSVLLQCEDGYWRYATYQNGCLTDLGERYGIDSRPVGASDGKTLAKAVKLDPPVARQIASRSGTARLSEEFPRPAGPQKLVVLLVSFSNISIKNTDDYWANKIFGDTIPGIKTDTNSSVNDYYKEVSNGSFYFLRAEESNGKGNDGIISVTLEYDHPIFSNDFTAASNRVAHDALVKSSANIDFSFFDSDQNGTVSPDELHIVMILAGNEKSYNDTSANAVWAHNYGLQNGTGIMLDGVAVGGDYSQLGEMHGSHPATIGVITHELGHSLSLPDLYDTIDQSSMGLGPYSLMAEGSWGYNADTPGCSAGSCPTHLDAWCKSLLGFVDPEVRSTGTADLYSFDTGSYNAMKLLTLNPKQYFLLENRGVQGYDRSLSFMMVSSGGILCLHIDESVLDSAEAQIGGWYQVNADEHHKAVDVEEANEGILRYSQMDTNASGRLNSLFRRGIDTCLWFFGDTTAPNSKTYSGMKTGVYFRVESDCGPAMSVLFDDILVLPVMAAPQREGRTIRWTCTAEGGTGKTYRFDAYKDDILTGGGTSGYSENNWFDWKPTGPGSYKIKASVQAGGGTIPATAMSDPYEIAEDVNGPVIAVTADGKRLSMGNVTARDVAVGLTDADTDDLLAAYYTRNGGSPVSEWPAGGLFTAEGEYTISVSDLAGNIASFRFAIDKTAPTVSGRQASGATAISGGHYSSAITVTVSDSRLLSKKAARNGNSMPWPAGGRFSSDGTWRIVGVDSAGNVGSIVFTIDTAKPVVTAMAYSGSAVKNGGIAAGGAFVTISDGNLLSVSAKMGTRTIAWPRGGRFTVIGTYTVTAKDRAGNVTVFKFTVK